MSRRPGKPSETPLLVWGDALRAEKQRRKRLGRRIAAVGASLAVLLASALLQPTPRLVWNASASAPIGLYWLSPGAIVEPGEMVIARTPEAFRRMAAERDYLPMNVPLVKRAIATAGDEVCALGQEIFLNGRRITERQLADRAGRPMPMWSGCVRLRGRQLFLLMDNPASFDGRYFGVTERQDVIGRARLLCARSLSDESLRDEFYKALSAFSRTLTVAVASRTFVEETPPERMSRWRSDEKRFIALRAHVKTRYADAIDWSDYEKRVRALLDNHVTAHEVITVVEPLAVFDDAAIDAARSKKNRSDASIADEIAHRTLRAIEEKWDEDPVFFEKFSKLIRDTIAAFRDRRLEEKAYLDHMRSLRDRIDTREDSEDPTPPVIRGKGNETAFWGIARRELKKVGLDGDGAATDIAIAITDIIERNRTVGWQHDRDLQNRIRNAIDDFFFDQILSSGAINIGPDVIDMITDDVLASARVRMADDGRIR